MTKTEKRGRVPRLRFPEFREAGEWEKKSLADVCHRITNGKANAEDHEDDGIYPLYDRSEVVKKSSEYAFDDEAVIIPGEGMRFQPKYHKGKFNLHQRAYALMQHQGNARFVYYTLDRFKDTLAKNAVKSTVLSLRLPIIERFSLAVPDKKEQQKIADCLSSLDDLITLEIQKLNALKTHKKGLMQRLFPAEGETVPRLRFPEFREAGEWIKTKICDAVIYESSTLAQGKLQITSGGYPVFGADGIVGYIGFFDQKEDYIAIVKDGSGAGRLTFTKGRSSILSTLGCLRPKSIARTETLWLFYCLLSLNLKNHIKGSGIPHLYFSDYGKEEIGVPAPGEQQKIADCLSSLDDLITAQAQKVEVLKKHKKGLMQQLFPVLDDAIG